MTGVPPSPPPLDPQVRQALYAIREGLLLMLRATETLLGLPRTETARDVRRGGRR